MKSTTTANNNPDQKHFLITILFLIAVSAVSYTLLTEHQTLARYYFIYPLCMLAAYFMSNIWFKRVLSVVTFALLLAGSYLEPLNISVLSQSFILVPLCYIAIFPGSLWPIAVALSILGIYIPHITGAQVSEFVEASIELSAIAIFATGGTFYKQKLSKQVERYRKDSLTDFLTQVSNRKAFKQDLESIAKIAGETSKTKFALLLLDLDDFKQINDSLGHQQGDLLLIQFAKRLSNLDFNRINIYRLSGDEFAVLLQDKYDVNFYSQQVATYILEACQSAYHLDKRSYTMTISIGIASLDDALYDTDIWCRNVDIALKRAKQAGKNSIQWFDENLIGETVRSYQIERELSDAIEKGQLALYYQPKVDIKTNLVHGAEALIRWKHPDLGIIPPDEFVGVAERSQQIIPIGRWVIETACQQAKAWDQLGHPICVAVNVSTVQFLYDDIFHVVTKALRDSQLNPQLLQLEITETTLMQQPQRVVDACHDLRTLGIRVAIDDFGVAYSSLNYLKQLPIDVLKIDKSFIDECCSNHNDHMLVRTIIQLGHNMGKVVTAEGVVNDEQLYLLATEGCDEYQGYLYSRPVPPYEFMALLSSRKDVAIPRPQVAAHG
ncbi:putative bifunctional diguanylate cyclase/phosphodiesterase [Vibrio diazotrophicus]|uniref:putative bifunctional diguanylate cyclase/phosphodiesterase n=1 Tax=Vibrio diazotrophicus TaxID=685 RepID=UPI0005A63ADB|nr:bifunctional diguanylate cyclase/phosphodiesterase [Vibrio diazotrophicus]